jgi:hypothetical protein
VKCAKATSPQQSNEGTILILLGFPEGFLIVYLAISENKFGFVARSLTCEQLVLPIVYQLSL